MGSRVPTLTAAVLGVLGGLAIGVLLQGAGAIAALASAVGVAGALAGVALQFALSRAQSREAREEAARIATEERLREWNMRVLAQTREGMLGYLHYLERRVVLRQEAEPPDALTLSRMNMRFVGDAQVLFAYMSATTELTGRLPLTNLDAEQLGPLRVGELDTSMVDRISKVRDSLTRALDAQELRALRGDALAEPDAAQLRTVPGPDVLLEQLRAKNQIPGGGES